MWWPFKKKPKPKKPLSPPPRQMHRTSEYVMPASHMASATPPRRSVEDDAIFAGSSLSLGTLFETSKSDDFQGGGGNFGGAGASGSWGDSSSSSLSSSYDSGSSSSSSDSGSSGSSD